MKIINPKSLIIINELPPLAKKGDRVSVDSEFFNQEKSRLHRAHGDFAWLGCSFDGVTVYYITEESQIQEFFDRLNAGVWIFHHAKYDLTQLRRFANIPDRNLLWDSMLIEQIMFSGYYNEFGLNDLARRYLGIYMDKGVRAEFSDHDTVSMSREQVEYAAVDVVATWRVYQEQRKIIDETDLEIWKSIELPFMWTILSMGGISLDVEKWQSIAKGNADRAFQIRDKYPSLNINSVPQLKKYFKEELGIIAQSTDVSFLEAHQDIEFCRDLLEYRTYQKRASTYGESFVTDYVEPDGKIYASIYQLGTETGRCSCRNPNLQNQPHEKQYRECFIAGKDSCLIVADYGSQEPRIAAYFSQDRGLIDALNGKEKLYIAIARDVLGKTITKDSPEYSHIKSTILGIFYGMSAKGLAERIGVSVDDAQDMINAILETYPGIYEYMRTQKMADKYVTTIYGRKIWLNKYSYQWERNALNAPIQGSAADATKLAASRFAQEWQGDNPLRLLVHDEIVIEVPDDRCEEAKALLEKVMVEVAEEMHDGIKAVAEIYSGANWGVKS